MSRSRSLVLAVFLCISAPAFGQDCQDTDNGAADSYGDFCHEYVDHTTWCGNYDDDDFTSNAMCCACGGGSHGPPTCAHAACPRDLCLDGSGRRPIGDDCCACPTTSTTPTCTGVLCPADICPDGSGRRQIGDDCCACPTTSTCTGMMCPAVICPDGSGLRQIGDDCCACPSTIPPTISIAPTPPAICQDTDNGAADKYGDFCHEYVGHTVWCGSYDDDDFTSNAMCCACGGGHGGPPSRLFEPLAKVSSQLGAGSTAWGSSVPVWLWLSLPAMACGCSAMVVARKIVKKKSAPTPMVEPVAQPILAADVEAEAMPLMLAAPSATQDHTKAVVAPMS